jgi:DnaJ-class molecular chaperone
MESLMSSVGSQDGSINLPKLMELAASMANSLSSGMSADEKDDIKNMSTEEQVSNVTERVMNMMGSLGSTPSNACTNSNDIRVSLDVTVAELVKGIHNKKLKYKRHVDNKDDMVKEKVIINTEPMTLEKTMTFKGKGDNNSGDLIVSLNVIKSPSLSIDTNSNLVVRHTTIPLISNTSVPIVSGLDIDLFSSDVTDVTFRLDNKGFLMPNGTRTAIIVKCISI